MIYLGLGANLGDRRDNLRQAIRELAQRGFAINRVSPVVETPAMLPHEAESEWIRPYLNCVVEGDCDWTPHQALTIIKQIERASGRQKGSRWAPRPLDIDLLLWHDRQIDEPDLKIPHYGIAERSFVLTPMLHLIPGKVIIGQQKSIIELSQSNGTVPLWMGIINLTLDSFSGDGLQNFEHALLSRVDSFINQGVQIIDLGAESTRPNAGPVSPEEEWHRLKPALDVIMARIGDNMLSTRVSVDSRHWQTLEKAVEFGIHYINDVSGLRNPAICSIVRDSGCEVVAMHSLTVPVDPLCRLPTHQSAVDQIELWITQQKENWIKAGLDPGKIIIDPGIGFGKSALQSIELLRHCQQLRNHGIRLLIGHSRKSFMQGFCTDSQDRDPESLGIALAVCRHTDIFRVHNPLLHMRAHLAWQHLQCGI